MDPAYGIHTDQCFKAFPQQTWVPGTTTWCRYINLLQSLLNSKQHVQDTMYILKKVAQHGKATKVICSGLQLMHETCYATAYAKLHVDLQAEPTRTSPHGHYSTRSLTQTSIITVLKCFNCKQDIVAFMVQLIGTLKYVAAAMQANTRRNSIAAAVHMQLNLWHCVKMSLCCTKMFLRYCNLLTISALSSSSIKLALYSCARSRTWKAR